MSQDADTFLASLHGNVVRCSTVEDAIAVNMANAVLRGSDGRTSRELDRAASVLMRYGCQEAAYQISRIAERQRAADLLTRTVRGRRIVLEG